MTDSRRGSPWHGASSLHEWKWRARGYPGNKETALVIGKKFSSTFENDAYTITPAPDTKTYVVFDGCTCLACVEAWEAVRGQ